MAERILRAERLRDILLYDPTSKSALRWRADRVLGGFGEVRAGDEAGGVMQPEGRTRTTPCWVIQTSGMSVVGHNAVWEVVNGPIPRGCVVAHRDGDTLNNKIDNLYLWSKSKDAPTAYRLPIEDIFECDTSSPSGLKWKIDWSGRAVKGSPAGTKMASGSKIAEYWMVRIYGRFAGVHRIVWQLTNGPIPDGMEIDHIDGNGLNNLLSNLRIVTTATNCRNRSMRSDNKTGIVGVMLDRQGSRYRAQWKEMDGKLKTRSFSIAKYGEDAARQMAATYRAEQVARLNSEGAGYTARHIEGGA